MIQYDTRIKLKSDTTAHWLANPRFIPLAGEVLVYTDYETDANGDYIPAMKIGDGQTYGVDLPFVSDDIRNDILNHTRDENVHITAQERLFWNNKLNVNDSQEVVNGVLIFNRN